MLFKISWCSRVYGLPGLPEVAKDHKCMQWGKCIGALASCDLACSSHSQEMNKICLTLLDIKKFQIPDYFPDVEFPNLFHLTELEILMILEKKFILLLIRGAEKSTKTIFKGVVSPVCTSQCTYTATLFVDCSAPRIGKGIIYFFKIIRIWCSLR